MQKIFNTDSVIIIFAREPVAGQVKTRLIPALGDEGACQLYTQLLDHTLNTVIASVLADIIICITPESHQQYFLQMHQAQSFSVSVQYGNDLGARMHHALASALSHYSKAILIGTDCPFLSSKDLYKAMSALNDYDMVFSPAYDGGYVLVGAKKTDEALFLNIDWGSSEVMEQTRIRLQEYSILWYELEKQHDIDIAEDLSLLSLNKNGRF